MAIELYKIEYVEMTPSEAEDSEEGLEILEVVAEVDGDVFDAVHFWAIDMEWTLVNHNQIGEGIPKLYLSPTHYMVL
ncbi:hypothetical protein [Nostoc sp.]|uniref:hypothetical protein n=1 Tax=Nostoc sp. TaxID=1180 RepID=UPI002FF7C029